MITKEQIQNSLTEASQKRDQLYAAKLAEQEKAITQVIETVIANAIERISYNSPRVINFADEVFKEEALPEIRSTVEELGLKLDRQLGFSTKLIGQFTF